MRKLKHTLNRLRLRVLAAQPAIGAPVYRRSRTTRDRVALSFDDGPSAANTAPLLDVLAAHNARATFFVVGEELVAAPELARLAVGEGHELGNHTFSHPFPEGLSDEELLDEIARGNVAIEDAAGITPTIARPPFGRHTRRFASLARSLQLRTVMWSLDSGDTWGYDAESIARFVGRARGGDIVLLHDGGPDRPAMLGAIEQSLQALTSRGLECVTVSQLLSGIEQDGGGRGDRSDVHHLAQ
jgi:peptidoglycan/xylan/chitin deacetylase (PgdA/CDA1 family)